MKNLLKLLLIFIFTTINLIASQKQTNEIANISASSLYNINKNSLQSTIKVYIKNNPEIKALKITEVLSGETYISIYRSENAKIVEGELLEKNQYIQYKANATFEGEKVGEVFAYYKNKELINLSEEEKEWLNKNPITLSVDDRYAPMNFKNTKNQMDGLSIDYIKLIEKKLGYPIKLDSHPWPIALDNAMKHKTDGIINANYTQERAEKLLFTESYITVPMVLITSENSKIYNNLSELKNKTILVKEKTVEAMILPKKYPQINVRTVSNYKDALVFVSTGKADGVFGHMAVLEYENNQYLLPNLKKNFVSFGDFISKQAIGINNTKTILRDILNKTIRSISQKEKKDINDKWMKPIKKDIANLSFQEINWLKQNPPISIAVVDNYPPYDFRDKENKLDGFHSELTELINTNLGINIKLKTFDSWSKAYNSVLENNTDAIYSLSWSSEREEKYFNYSSPYHFSPYHLVTKNNSDNVSLEDINEEIIAVEQDTIFKNIVEEIAPKANILFVKDTKEAYESVKNGKAFATISPNIEDNLFKNSGLVIASEVYHKSSNLYIGSNKKNPIISSILTKGINSISLKDITQLRQKWFEKNKALIPLSSEEKKWIRDNPYVKVIEFFNEPPFTINTEKKSGYMYELLEEMIRLSGLEIKYVKGFNSFGSMVDSLEKGEVDIQSTFLSKIPLKKDSTIKKTKTILSTPFVVIGRSDSPTYKTINDLKGKRVAVVKGYAQDRHLSKIEGVIKVHVKHNDEGFKVLKEGKADYYINNNANSQYIIAKSFSTDIKVLDTLPFDIFPPLEFVIGLNGQKPHMVSILNKALEQVSAKKIQEIRNHWILESHTVKDLSQKISLTEKEHLFIKKHPKIKIHNEQAWAPFNFYEKGRARGLSIDYIKAILAKTGIEAEFITGPSWDEFIEMSKSKDIDIMLNIVKSPERKEFLNFTNSYAEIIQSVFIKDGSTPVSKIEDLFGKTFAVPKGFYYEEILKKYPKIKLLKLKDTLECLQAVASGKAYAMLDLITVVNYYKNKYKLDDIVLGGTLGIEGGSLPLHLGVRKDWPELVSILNKALASLSDEDINKIEEKWLFNNNQVKQSLIELNPQEKKWIQQNRIVVGVEEWAPVIFSHGGKDYDGITGDILRLIIERTGLKLEVINDTWEVLLRDFRDKKIDLLPATYYTQDRAKYGLYSEGYYKMLDYIYVKENNTSINSLKDLNGKTLAIPKDFGTIPKIKKNFPEIIIIETRDQSDSMQKVLRGEVDALYDGQIAIEYRMQEDLIVGLKGIPQKTFEAAPLHMFSHIDKPILRDILDKALKSIPPYEINKIKSKWLIEKRNEHIINSVNQKQNNEDTISIIIISVGIFLFLLFILIIITKFISNDFVAKSFGSSKFRIIALIILSIVIFMLATLVQLTLSENKKTILNSTKSDLEFVLKTTQDRLDIWIEERKNYLIQLGKDAELIRATKALLEVKNDSTSLKASQELKKVREYFKSRENEFGNLGFFIIDKNYISIGSRRDNNLGTKNLIANNNPKLLEKVFQGEAVFIPPMITDVNIKANENTNEHTMFFAIPIQNKSGEVIAVMTQRLDVEGKFSEIIQSGRIGQSGESYLFSKDGFMLTKSRFRDELVKIGLLKQGEKEYAKLQLRNPGGNLLDGFKTNVSIEKQPLTKMAQSAISLDNASRKEYSRIYSDVDGYKDYRGVDVFGAWIWYKKYGIGLTTEVDENEALNEFYTLRQNLLIITGLTLLLTVMAVIMLIILGEKATRSIQKANDDLNKLLESFDDNVIASKTDEKGIIKYASKAFCEISGYTKEELIGSPQNIVRHPEMPKEIFTDLWKTIKNGKRWKGEVKNKKKDGGFYWVEVVIEPEFDEKQNIVGYSAIRQDISSKKEVEELSQNLELKVEERTKELDENIAFMNTLIDNLPTAVFAKNVNDDFRFITWNRHSEKLFGMKAEDMIGKNDFDFFPKEQAEYFLKTDQEVVNKKEVTEILEEIVTTANGDRILNTLKIGILDENGNPNTLLGISIDITEQKKAQQTIIDQQEQFSSMASNVPGVIYRCKVDDGWTMLYISNEIEKLSGYAVSDFINNSVRTFADIMHEEDKQPVAELIQDQIDKNEKFLVDYRVIDKNGTVKWVRSQGQKSSSTEGVDWIDGVLFDVTEQKKLEEEVKQSQKRFLTLFDAAPDSIIIIKNGKLIDCNQKTLELFNVESRDKFRRDVDFMDLSPEYQDNELKSEVLTQKYLQRAISQGFAQFEWKHKKLNTDETFDAEVILAPIEINNEINIYGVVRDISQRKELERQIKEKQEQIEENKIFVDRLLDSQEQIVITTDGIRLRSCNKAFLDFFNLENMEEFTKDYACICDKFELDESATYLQKYMGEKSWIEYILANEDKVHKAVILRNGQKRTFTVTAATLPIGEANMKSAVFTDITEIEESRKNIETILSNIMLPVLITSKKTRTILYANEYASKQYEAPVEELIGSSIDNVYTKVEQKDEILSFMEEEGYVENLEERYKTNKGKEFIGLLSVKPISYNEEDSYIGMVVDITEQKNIEEEIRQIHSHTQSSIEYASLIQHSLIPSNDLFRKYFDDYFTIWHPKDIVGGDIYLFEELRNEDECLLMVIDCTGHGVPGAFVTMLVKAIERQIAAIIASEHNLSVSPAWILKYFNQTMKKLLKQENDEAISNAGFDGAVLYYNRREEIVRFAGAELPLFYTQDGEFKVIKGNRHSIGYKKSDANYEFKEHIIEAKEGMQFYMTSDGYLDQNGGAKGFPFGKKRFLSILEKYKDYSFADQQEVLLNELQEYQGDEERNDDISIVGIKIAKTDSISKENQESWVI